MRRRTKAREYALQILYQVDLAHTPPKEAISDFWTFHPVAPDVRQFATQLVDGTLAHWDAIDRVITEHADNWDIARMAVVDRNILRLGIFELLHLAEVPPKVCLNEAVELAKRYGDEESSKFVNGILDTVHKIHVRAAASASSASSAPDSPAV